MSGDLVRRDEPVRDWARFGWQTVNGFVEREPSYGFRGLPLYGCPLQTHWLYGSFQSVHREGAYYAALKHYNVTGSLSLQLYQAEPGDDFRFCKEGTRAYRGGCYGGRRDDRWGVWDLVSSGANQRFTLNVADNGDTHWYERELIDVQGSQLGALMQSYVPDTESPMIYTSRGIKAHGVILGEEVEGFFFQDFHHLGVGQDWMVTEFFNGVQGLWVVFATEYVDGGWDIGNFFIGRGGFSSAMVQRSTGERFASTNFAVEVDIDARDYVARARAVIDDGEVWQWTTRYADGRPRMPVMNVAGSPHWNEGVVVKVGEDRAWRTSEAWMEIYPSTLEEVATIRRVAQSVV